MINGQQFLCLLRFFFLQLMVNFFQLMVFLFLFLHKTARETAVSWKWQSLRRCSDKWMKIWIFVLLKKALSRDQEKTHPDLISSTSYKGGAFKYVKVKLNQWSREIYSTDADSNGFFDRRPPAPSLASDKYRVKKEPEMSSFLFLSTWLIFYLLIKCKISLQCKSFHFLAYFEN